jgi:hypothetical protein
MRVKPPNSFCLHLLPFARASENIDLLLVNLRSRQSLSAMPDEDRSLLCLEEFGLFRAKSLGRLIPIL